MGEFAGLIFGAAWAAMAIVVVINFYFAGSLLNKLKEQHPSTWITLGSPTLFWNNSPKNQLATFSFIFKGKYKQLNDPVITRICNRIRITKILGFIVFVVMTVSFFILQATPLKS